ncbi:ABC transporter related protein [Hydrogenobacter thermophilus TK-6]|uniref:ABC transporter ATP-binding protein n=1 Tax=Hydrogenobacter thermophilus (strain DSM 6534 / IAM 12695 / TK-6) TaxID=608538 RepID=D3DI31_HYDTT|nr:ABC transporter ATP-binding protein [Hydrogenobacter thermophilus]ADO45415.1 ABC transporter related protein [Hydrogenobacter thermophilus TK-6]BAI69483.1 ABC transporter ATP-binding protein [Hydrogenobacter thermophilus TK-6]
MANVIVELKNVSKSYTGSELIPVLKSVYLTVELGKIYIILGPSGSGKTTLLNIIGLLDKPSEGEVFFEGERVDTLSEDELAVKRAGKISYIFQDIRLIPTLSAIDNILLPTYFVKYKIDFSFLEYLLNSLNLNNKVKMYPSQLSGGQAQRVAIIRALITKPMLLLADEPTANLDTKNKDIVKEILYNYSRENNASVVLATHDQSVVDIGDYVLCISDGVLKRNQDCLRC